MMKDIPLKMFVFLIWTPQPATQFCVSPVVSSNMLDVREYQGSRMRDEFSRQNPTPQDFAISISFSLAFLFIKLLAKTFLVGEVNLIQDCAAHRPPLPFFPTKDMC